VDIRHGLRRARARLALSAAVAVSLFGALAPVAGAQPPSVPGSTEPGIEISRPLPARPGGFELGAREAIRIANPDPKVQETRRRWGKLAVAAEAELPSTWKISYLAEGEERAQVLVDDPTATVRESWTGYQVAWQMARGYEGSFGHLLNAAYVWIPLSALFFLGLFDFRRPRRIVHLDLLVLLSFSFSHIVFNDANIGVSVPLTYPPLVYLLARMLWVGFRGPGDGLRPSAPIAWLAIAACFLIGFRIALNVADSGVIDVGYSGVIGADRVVHGEALYGEDAFPDDNPFGDTYGPLNYYFYVPFELVFPWSGEWDSLPAGHAAALFFDLLTVALLFLLGRRLRTGRRGTDLGVILAFAWAAYPYTAYTLQANANDTLVAALVVGALLVIGSPPVRGAMAALAGLTKLAPLALIPLLAAGPRAGLASTDPETGERPLSRPRVRALALFALGLAGVGTLVLLQTLLDPGLPTFFERTIENQVARDSPFSIWGQVPSLDWAQVTVQIAAAALAALVGFLPRRRTLTQIAALAASVLIAVQLTADHWFYLYIVWFLPAMLAASAGRPPAIGDEAGAVVSPRAATAVTETRHPVPSGRT
jgi:Glycosyltransferase family 87